MTPDAARLFLISPVLSGAPGEGDAVLAALAGSDVACVLVRHGARDERGAKALLRTLVEPIQAAGAALLVEADPRLAAHGGADGVQVAGVGDPLEAALASMKPDRIVGVAGLESRDDAMTAGEHDVDYLLFGEPRPDGTAPEPAWTLERVRWWAEIFNVPCVGYAQTLADVEALAEAGAEFVALGDAVFADPRGPAAAMAEAALALTRAAASRAAAR